MGVMPICRSPRTANNGLRTRNVTHVAQYVVRRRVTPRAANDNRSAHHIHAWHWVMAVAIGPTLTAIILFSGLF